MNIAKKEIRYYVPARGNHNLKARLKNRWAYLDLGDATHIRVGLDEGNNIVIQPTHRDDPFAIGYNRKTKAIYIKGIKDTFGIKIPPGDYRVEKDKDLYRVLTFKEGPNTS